MPGVSSPSVNPAACTAPAVSVSLEQAVADVRWHQRMDQLSAMYSMPLVASRAIAVGLLSCVPLVPLLGMHPAPGDEQPSSQPTLCVPAEPLMLI